MRVGILELLVESESRNWVESAYGAHFKRYYCSITPQVVAVWCRQLGHQAFYATFYGHQDPKSLLPDDLDVVFIATYTQRGHRRNVSARPPQSGVPDCGSSHLFQHRRLTGSDVNR